MILKSHYLNSSLVGKRCPPLRARLSGSPDRTAASPGSSDNRLRFAFARGALAAEIDVQGRRPESPWAGLADRTRRVTRAVSGAGPPRHRHIAAVDRIEPPLGPAPVNAVGAKGADRGPGCGDAVAAAVGPMGQGPMRRGFGTSGRFGRPAIAHALAVAQLAPEGAGAAILRSFRHVVHSLPCGISFTIWTGSGVTSIVLGGYESGAVHPPPSASIRPMSDSSWRVCSAIARRSASSAVL